MLAEKPKWLQIAQVAVLVAVLASALMPQAVLAAPAADLDIESEVWKMAKTVGRILAVVAAGLGVLSILGGQQLLQIVGIQVQQNFLIRIFLGVAVLGAGPSIIDFLFGLI